MGYAHYLGGEMRVSNQKTEGKGQGARGKGFCLSPIAHSLLSALLFTFHFSLFTVTSAHAVRLKEIAGIEGVRQNQLIGYGVVIGLNGTGDKKGTTFTVQSLASMLQKMGIKVSPNDVKVKNIAAVMVTADLPPFAKPGGKLDVLVSSIGDAQSLQGGTLLMTPLKGPDGQVYAVAQGAVSVGGYIAGGGGESAQKNHPTVGMITNGALVEKGVVVDVNNKEVLSIMLNRPDFTTAQRVASAVNAGLGDGAANAVDGATINLKVPDSFKGKVVELVSLVEGLDVAADAASKVVVNERTGTVVMGENVRISTVAISHGNLSIRIKTEFAVSQPQPFTFTEGARTTVVPKQELKVEEQEARLIELPSGVSLNDVVKALNAVGVTPRDLIAILQAMKAAGALQAELVII
jgi:flagellar P-ring protein precursor FlgI